MIRYNSYRTYLKEKFGIPVLKVPLNGGFSCPNRDGTKSSEGCRFCDNVSFSPAALSTVSPLAQLIDTVRRSSKFEAFLPYLQPFSNTYGPLQRLKDVYEPLLSVPGVIGLAIGTRPDCFDDSIYGYLEELASRTYLCIELGLQSSNDSTLQRLNRGHTFNDFCKAVERLSNAGIETVAHVMMGLPGESEREMLQTARDIASLPVSGVKIHQLMVIRGTALEESFNAGTLKVLTLEEYSGIICGFLPLIRPDQYIHRLMADSKESLGLVAPMWSAKKAESIAFLNAVLERENIVQGSEKGL